MHFCMYSICIAHQRKRSLPVGNIDLRTYRLSNLMSCRISGNLYQSSCHSWRVLPCETMRIVLSYTKTAASVLVVSMDKNEFVCDELNIECVYRGVYGIHLT